jgi:mRNA interferase RelE/StbE
VGDYRVLIRRTAAKELHALAKRDRQRVVERVGDLSSEPRPWGAEKLSGEEKYRIRQGDIRILYEIDDADSTVTVVKVGAEMCTAKHRSVRHGPTLQQSGRRPRSAGGERIISTL